MSIDKLYEFKNRTRKMHEDNLTDYIETIKSQTRNEAQYNNISMDQEACPLILKNLNIRYSSMNVEEKIIDVEKFAEYDFNSLTKFPRNTHKRFIISVHFNGVHYAAANVFKDGENKVSVIFLDSSRGNNIFIPLRWNKFRKTEKDEENKVKTLYIYCQIQNSPGDCLIFSLHFLKKMHEYAQEFTNIHQSIFNDEIKFNNDNYKLIAPKSKNLEKVSDDSCKEYRVVFFNEAINLLPIDFFKHSQSLNPIDAYLERHPNESNKKVNKYAGGETLKERYQRYLVTRELPVQYNSNETQKYTYSCSIEEKRLKLAQDALHDLYELRAINAMRSLHWFDENK
ncbi:hypothetical protein FE392_11115 [Xenorhabdus sp. 12]|uniref:Uncharacterized protein n=1 Tax=Xenorhabdus santafensis TaxID=2582833 RepID=A0ABU4SAT8_9GAMM|nr:YopJ family acetyltransferase [Xenorhabdus sp. 12]MDX7987875.1 hypothetical protein [Xenorhabdus sp. 12]